MVRSPSGRSVSGSERRWLKVFGTLDEFQARLFAADKALDLGRGGMSRVAALTGLSRTTITKAVEELRGGGKLVSPGEGRARRAGGGRKRVEEVDPDVRDLLDKILEETTAGDPMSLLRWTNKSTRTMAEELTRSGHPVTWVTVARCLNDNGVFVAGQPQDEGRTATRQPGCAVPVHQPAGESIVGGGRPGDFGRRQEEGIGGTL